MIAVVRPFIKVEPLFLFCFIYRVYLLTCFFILPIIFFLQGIENLISLFQFNGLSISYIFGDSFLGVIFI